MSKHAFGKIRLSSSRSNSPIYSPTNLSNPMNVGKGIDDTTITSPSPDFMGSPPAVIPPGPPVMYTVPSTNNTNTTTTSSSQPTPNISSTPPASQMSDVYQKLTSLLPYRDTLIKDLPSPSLVKDTYTYLINLVRMIYGTDDYTLFYKTAQQVFNYDNVKPDTVGAYFHGCAIATNLNYPYCGTLCANSLPPPGGAVCQYPIIIAVYNQNKYQWVILNNTEPKTQALIFVSDTFRGFSTDEKQQLSTLGFTSVMIYQTSPDGKTYTPITKDFTSLDIIMARDGVLGIDAQTVSKKSKFFSKSATQPSNSMMSTGVGVAIGIIILVIIILIIIICLETFTNYLPTY